MTRDEFDARYALLEPVAADGARSFHAVTPAGGVVMVHFLDGGVTQSNLALLSALERLEPGRRARVREVTAVDGAIAVVTDRIEDFRSLPAWLEAAPAAAPAPVEESSASPTTVEEPAAPVVPPSRSADLPASGSGEFTRLFRAGDLSAAASPSPAPAAPAPVAPEVPTAAPTAASGDAIASDAAPGEFTRLFRAMDLDAASGSANEIVTGGAIGSAPSESRAEPLPSPVSPERTPDANRPAVSPLPSPSAEDDRHGADPDFAKPMAGPAADDLSPPAAADGALPAFGATGAFAAATPPAGGETELPAAGAPAGGAYTRLFQRMETPAWSADPRERPSADAAPLPPVRPGGGAEPPVEAGYLERLYAPSPEPPRAPAHESVPAAAGRASPALSLPAAPAPSLAAPPAAAAAALPSSAAAQAEPAPEAARPGNLLVAGLAIVAVLAILLVLLVVTG